MSNTADKVIKIALAEEGYLEKSKQAYNKSHNVLDSKEEGAGSDNYTKYGRDMHELYPKVMDFAAPWCDCFVDWCFYKAYGKTNAQALLGGDFNDYTRKSAQLYKDKNAWYTNNPQVGDQIFFKNKFGNIVHTGLVLKVEKGYVYTIEGNTSSAAGVVANGGCVRIKSYSLVYNRIDGYGRPKYDGPGDVKSIIGTSEQTVWHNLVEKLQKALNAEYDAQLEVNGVACSKTLSVTPTLNVSIRSTKPQTVKALQHLLSYWGYKCWADGDFYTATEKMVKSFQKDKVGLAKPDGELTAQKKSWKVLLNLQKPQKISVKIIQKT